MAGARGGADQRRQEPQPMGPLYDVPRRVAVAGAASAAHSMANPEARARAAQWPSPETYRAPYYGKRS
eukprot:3928817-Prymnesium_polylepis.1